MPEGGSRKGAGRPKGSTQAVTKKAREAAMLTGMLPHEWLLAVARGDVVKQMKLRITYDAKGKEKSREWIEEEYYADFATRIDAAKAAAPFYAPKLAVQQIGLGATNPDRVAKALEDLAEKLPG